MPDDFQVRWGNFGHVARKLSFQTGSSYKLAVKCSRKPRVSSSYDANFIALLSGSAVSMQPELQSATS